MSSVSLDSCDGGFVDIDTPSLEGETSFVDDVIHKLTIIAVEGFADIRHVLPAVFLWIWSKYVIRDITTVRLDITGTDGKVRSAYLNIHGDLSQIQVGAKVSPVLLCHGDYSHPLTMLHLANIAVEKKLPTFSLYIPLAHLDEFDIDRALLDQAVEKIEEIVQAQGGVFDGVYGIGHSKGAILLADKMFVRHDPTAPEGDIKSVCAIAGRLRDDESCEDDPLKQFVKRIYAAICDNPFLPLTIIVGDRDWNAPQEAMKVREENCHVVAGAMHLSILYESETCRQVSEFLPDVRVLVGAVPVRV